jgi:D-glycero-alpha-D-manno-heptose-7-phosphate kinase
MSDISTIGTGLGGSSAVTVGILKALFQEKTHQEIAELACHLEINILKKQIGKQDQYICAFGGINQLIFEKDGIVKVNFIDFHDIMKSHFYLLKFNNYNIKRKAEQILKKQNSNFERNINILHKIKNLCFSFKKAIHKNDQQKMINLLNHYNELKKQLVENDGKKNDDLIIKEYIKKGCGIKSCGAGQNGYFFIYDPSDKCPGIPVKIDYIGTKILK